MNSPPTTRTGWITYDAFTGPTLASSPWEPPDFGSGPRLEPEARTTVEDGVVTVDVPRFMNCDETNQGLDNSKHLLVTKRGSRRPADGAGRFAVDLHAEVGDGSGDYRQGLASFILVDTTGRTPLVLSIFSNGDRFFAEQEILGIPGQEHPFTRVIDDPFFVSRAGSPPSPGYRR